MDFFKKAVGGNDNLAKVAGQKAGEFVEQTVQGVISGNKGKDQQQQQPQQPQQQPQQQQEGDDGCFGLEDALKQDGENAAGGLKDMAAGLFK